MLQVVRSTSAAARLAAAARFLEARPSSTEIILVSPSRGAADDLARATARRLGATFGITRFSLTELAARAAAAGPFGTERAPGSQAATEAIAARAVFDARAASELAYFAPVARMPGFPKALARTIHELRLAGVSADGALNRRREEGGSTVGVHPAMADLRRLLERIEGELDRAAIHDRAALFAAAAAAWRSGHARWAGLPAVLLDLTIDSRSEQEFVAALVERAPAALATVPDGDARALASFERMGAAIDVDPDAAQPSTDLAHLRRYVFTNQRPPLREPAGDVRLFSAPGEGREAAFRCTSIAARGGRILLAVHSLPSFRAASRDFPPSDLTSTSRSGKCRTSTLASR